MIRMHGMIIIVVVVIHSTSMALATTVVLTFGFDGSGRRVGIEFALTEISFTAGATVITMPRLGM